MLPPRIALVYDRVNTPHGGAEKVLQALHQAFPDAPLYTSVYDPDQAQWAQDFEVRTSFLQQLPIAHKLHRWLAVLMPLAFESFTFDDFDVVVSITSAEAKGIITKANQLHLCYLLTPTRYLYSHRSEYLASLPSWPVVRSVASQLLNYLSWWDRVAAQRPDIYLPISQLVAERCQQYYHRPTEPVIYPPVDETLSSSKPASPAVSTLLKQLNLAATEYYIVVSRLVGYKRIDLAIQACQKLGRPLVIVGEGPERSKLKSLAGPQTYFIGQQPDEVVHGLLRRAKALLMPGIEDFGITALEAVALGTPALIHAQSGVAEIIEDGKIGIHLPDLTVSAMVAALKRLERTRFNRDALPQSVRKYATTTFVQNMRQTIHQSWQRFTAQQKGKL